MRSPRSVTLTPIALPVRSRNWAIERRARVTTGFWPVIGVRSPTAASIALALRQRLAEADVDDDLGQARHLHRVGVAELLPERRHDLVAVALAQLAAHLAASRSLVSGSPQWAHTRTLRPSAERSWRTRVGAPQCGQTTMTLLAAMGLRDVEDAALLDARLALGAAGRSRGAWCGAWRC